MTVADSSTRLILSPGLSSALIINQYKKSYIRFYCYSPVERHIELWTNLTSSRKWSGIPFTQQLGSNTEYTLQINTRHLPLGKYEYTLRYSAPLDTNNDDKPTGWFWYGMPDKNGSIYIVQNTKDAPTAPSFASVPQLRFVAKEHTGHDVDLWHFRTQSAEEPFSLGKLNHSIHRYMCLIQKGSTWLTPVSGANDFQGRNTSEKCQLFLYQDGDKGDIHLWMIFCQYADCYISFEADKSLKFHHNPGKDAHLLIVSTTNKRNFTRLIQTAFNYYNNAIKQVKEGDKTTTVDGISMLDTDAVLLDKLGYCTWNSFGPDVDLDNLNSAMNSLKTHNIPVEYLMIDDGWQSVTQKRQMSGFDACHFKFPGGLKKTINQLKANFSSIRYIGVWHALWGYWNGIDQAFAIENGLRWSSNSQSNREIGIIDNPKDFYKQFYLFLNESGVDFVKVDNQGSFQDLKSTSNEVNVKLWDDFRQAMVDSGDEFLDSRVLHCMSLTPHLLFDPILSLRKKSIFRNSDDFFPNEKDSHVWHIYANAMNSLLTISYPAIGDWDMFQSDHPFAEYHASSRAISGGPIYITDIPGKHNVELIYKLVAETKHDGYTILRSSQAPLSTFETVFNNSMDSESLVALYNIHQEPHFENEGLKELVMKPKYGVCGFWNTGPHDNLAIISSDLFCSKKLAIVPTVAYVVSGPDRGKVVPLEPSYDHQNDDDSSSINSVSSNCSSNSINATSNGDTNPLSKIPMFMQSYTETTTSPAAMMARIAGFGSTLVSVSTVQCSGLLSMACLGLIDKFNGTVCISHTEIIQYEQPYRLYATFVARLSHKSSFCGFWIKTHDNLKRRNSRIVSVGLVPCRVRIDDQVLDTQDWTWCSSTGLLVVDMMAVPSPNDRCGHDDFVVQIDIKKN